MIVEPDMTVPGHPEIFVIGDLSNFSHQTGKPLPGVAQPAIQQGHYVAKVIAAADCAAKKLKPFHYFDKGNLATIGRGAAVADLNWLQLSGLPAWLIWIFIHLMYIVQFQNRLLVFTAVGVALSHLRPLRAADHRQESVAAGFVMNQALEKQRRGPADEPHRFSLVPHRTPYSKIDAQPESMVKLKKQYLRSWPCLQLPRSPP